MYEKCIKRILDILCALAAMLVFCWLYLIVALLVRFKLGKPVVFKQPRPGRIDPKTGQERIFIMYKFRSMTDARDENGNLLPDEQRLIRFGRILRSTSLDELPEAWNILKGDMSVIGPRPQLVRDMVFMTKEQRRRHLVRPGLSGLAQVRGRNGLAWEARLAADLEYIEKISFLEDIKILLMTVIKVFYRDGITEEGEATSTDFGDYLLEHGLVTRGEYEVRQNEARNLLRAEQ